MERKIEVSVFRNRAGKEPFTNWLQGLDTVSRLRVLQRMNRVKHGNLGDYKKIGDRLYELRLFFGGGYRIYFTMQNNTIVILLCAGDKSTQSKDIKKALTYMRECHEKN